jgi:hypothetical protein
MTVVKETRSSCYAWAQPKEKSRSRHLRLRVKVVKLLSLIPPTKTLKSKSPFRSKLKHFPLPLRRSPNQPQKIWSLKEVNLVLNLVPIKVPSKVRMRRTRMMENIKTKIRMKSSEVQRSQTEDESDESGHTSSRCALYDEINCCDTLILY